MYGDIRIWVWLRRIFVCVPLCLAGNWGSDTSRGISSQNPGNGGQWILMSQGAASAIGSLVRQNFSMVRDISFHFDQFSMHLTWSVAIDSTAVLDSDKEMPKVPVCSLLRPGSTESKLRTVSRGNSGRLNRHVNSSRKSLLSWSLTGIWLGC